VAQVVEPDLLVGQPAFLSTALKARTMLRALIGVPTVDGKTRPCHGTTRWSACRWRCALRASQAMSASGIARRAGLALDGH